LKLVGGPGDDPGTSEDIGFTDQRSKPTICLPPIKIPTLLMRRAALASMAVKPVCPTLAPYYSPLPDLSAQITKNRPPRFLRGPVPLPFYGAILT
jgi:hypothetical protein